MGDTIQNIHGAIIATRGGNVVTHGGAMDKHTENRIEQTDFRKALIPFEAEATQYISENENFNRSQKQELTNLIDQLIHLLKQAPLEKKEDVLTIIEATRHLVSTAAPKEKNNKPMISVFASGLKHAAKSIADVLPKVLDVSSKIIDIISKLAL